MKITFLGSSHGVPEAHRRCACTMIEISGRYYLVDMGIHVIEELRTRGIPVEAVQGVFLTHMHGDHTNGLISFVDLLSWYFKAADPVICLPKMEAVPVIESWVTVNGAPVRHLRYQETAAGVVFDDGTLKVTAIPTQHCDRSYAYLLEAEGKKVLFTGDLKRPGVDFPAVIREEEIDLVICEAAHFPATEYLPVYTGSKVKRVCVNHYFPRNIPSIQQLEKELPQLKITMVNDGAEVTVS